MDTNLIELSATFPEAPERELPRDSMIRLISKRFGPDLQRMILEGPVGSGKTVHLAQYARHYARQSFSYFVSDNLWTRQPSSFLASICYQINAALGNRPLNEADLLIDVEKLKTFIITLTNNLIVKKIKREGIPYYYVIDGLDWALQGQREERIVDLLPFLPTHPKGLFLLCSCRTDAIPNLELNYQTERVQEFNFNDTREYLADTGLTQEEIRSVHESSDGSPGYLSTARELVLQDRSLAATLTGQPALQLLVGRQWSAARVDEIHLRRSIMALLTFTAVPISTETIASILGVSAGEVHSELELSGLTKKVGSTNDYVIRSESLKTFASEKLAKKRNQVLQWLIAYYEQHKDDTRTSDLLAHYYHAAENYPQLQLLVAPEQLVRRLREGHDLSILKRDLHHAAEMAETEKDWANLTKFAFASSLLNTVSDELVGEEEVMALIALQRYEEALSLAYNATLPELRIRLLARIYIQMKREGRHVSPQSLQELQQMSSTLLSSSDKEKILEVAADLFPLLPDVALQLVDNVIGKTEGQSALDLAVTYLSFRSEGGSRDEVLARISDPELQEFARVATIENIELSTPEILQQVNQISRTEAKIYALKTWCLHNKQSPEAQQVISAALDIINSDKDYFPPLRNLRQLSEPLKCCQESAILELVSRFDIPNFTSLRSPVEERVRLELNLAEAVAKVSIDKATSRLYETALSVMEDSLDADARCYCLARLLVTLCSIDFEDQLHLRAEVQERLKKEYQLLCATSADQLAIAKRTLRALTLVAPTLALEFAALLNTIERRDAAIGTVLTAYIRQDRTEHDVELIKNGLTQVSDPYAREHAVLELISEVARAGLLTRRPEFRFLIQEARSLTNPYLKARCVAKLIEGLRDDSDQGLRQELYKDLTAPITGEVQRAWAKGVLGFELVESVAKADRQLGDDLFARVKEFQGTSSIATPLFSSLYVGCLRLASRVVGKIGETMPEKGERLAVLERMIEAIPSPLLKIRLWSLVGLSLYRAGDRGSFDLIMRDRVLPPIGQLVAEGTGGETIDYMAPALYEYDPRETAELLKKLPRDMRDHSWGRIALAIILDANLDDLIGTDLYKKAIDNKCVGRVLDIAEHVETDTVIHHIVRALTQTIEVTPVTRMPEGQKLEALRKLEDLAGRKLPDKRNIEHNGYLVACLSAIERARAKSAKRAKHHLKSSWRPHIETAHAIPNIADRVLVTAWIAGDIHDIDHVQASNLLKEALEHVAQIPNVKDRISRLEVIAESWSKVNRETEARAALELAIKLTESLQGAEQEQIAASLIQTAHEFDPGFASELTSKLEAQIKNPQISSQLTVQQLVRNPQKLKGVVLSRLTEAKVLSDAAEDMINALVVGRGKVFDATLVGRWLAKITTFDANSGFAVASWAVETFARGGISGGKAAYCGLFDSILACGQLNYSLGNEISALPGIPESLRQSIPSLALNTVIFKRGERDNCFRWLENWLKENCRKYVIICDPYFSWKDLQFLKLIPGDVKVSIVTTWREMEGMSPGSAEVKGRFRQHWREEVSVHDPPPTLVVVLGGGDKGEFHDRFIVTQGAGLMLGKSFNGFGNQDFTVTILTPTDSAHIEEDYIRPRLNVGAHFLSDESIAVQVFTLAD